METALIETDHKDLSNWTNLHRTLQGIKLQYSAPVRNRLPVTISILRTLKNALRYSQSLIPVDQLMMWSAFTIAFFGFLRVSEFTAQSPTNFNEPTTMVRSDIHFDQSLNSLNITIKSSKTDPFRRGQNIIVAASGSSVCAVRAYLRYTSVALHPTQSPAFQFMDGSFLTRQRITFELQRLLARAGFYNTSQYTSHSFWSGAATTAAAAGIPDWLIKCLGRWQSDAYQVYIKTPIATLQEVPSIIAKHSGK
ncbi:uncharacterized protein LOC102808192 [Saccoglossus kowalevskii]|uniref:Uncharacterized protein LOC102808192 n=1 Tax=Saccoglossus kowalevskii TaxID=10224 RepID=A0ABM0MN88_SACKO|nr:PREDICTED: uncharacterized protein LOC102808192 [Saccoglossus kowalevskii]